MKIIICCVALLYCIAMVVAFPRHNNGGAVNLDDEARQYYNKITSRLSRVAIDSKNQHEVDQLLERARENFHKCQTTFGHSADMIGAYKGCLGRNTGAAMAQIGFIESIAMNVRSNESHRRY